MTLTIYNTQTRRKEAFVPLQPGKVKMYACGVTVYDYCHLGHARSYMTWDVVRRYLQWRGYEVEFVQNFTDIDDKIIKRSREQGSTPQELSERFIQEYFEDIRRLHILDADKYPRATENIPGVIQLIQTLVAQGYAYAAGGDVYYKVESFPEYGKLSGRSLDQMQAGASGRVAEGESKKKHPFDFALWKASKPGEPAWESPWGSGRPGWHIECSAMIRALLGDSIDIHGGGGDLVFPHHENEIAQSEAATTQPLARYWMHNGMVKIEGEKMSKSLGNFITIREFLDRPVDPMIVRLFVLQAQYRKPLDFTEEAIASASNGWTTLKEGLLFAQQFGNRLGWTEPATEPLTTYTERFQGAMDDDFNTSEGLAVIFELAKELRTQRNNLVHQGKAATSSPVLQQQWQTLVELAGVLGFSAEMQEDSKDAAEGLSDAEIDTLIEQRTAARKAKNYAEGDRLRDELQAQGIVLIDQPSGTTWHRS